MYMILYVIKTNYTMFCHHLFSMHISENPWLFPSLLSGRIPFIHRWSCQSFNCPPFLISKLGAIPSGKEPAYSFTLGVLTKSRWRWIIIILIASTTLLSIKNHPWEFNFPALNVITGLLDCGLIFWLSPLLGTHFLTITILPIVSSDSGHIDLPHYFVSFWCLVFISSL